MARIIPLELNKKLRKEYRLRFFSLLFLMLAIVSAINIMLMSSSYVLLSLYENIYTKENSNSNKDSEIVKENENRLIKLNQVFELSKKIPEKEKFTNIDTTKKLFEYAGSDTSIDSIEFLSEEEKTKITMRGMSKTRDSLLLFEEKIKNDNSFKDFSLPIETITKQKDVIFNVTFTHYDEN